MAKDHAKAWQKTMLRHGIITSCRTKNNAFDHTYQAQDQNQRNEWSTPAKNSPNGNHSAGALAVKG